MEKNEHGELGREETFDSVSGAGQVGDGELTSAIGENPQPPQRTRRGGVPREESSVVGRRSSAALSSLRSAVSEESETTKVATGGAAVSAEKPSGSKRRRRGPRLPGTPKKRRRRVRTNWKVSTSQKRQDEVQPAEVQGENWEDTLRGLLETGKTLDRPTRDPYFQREVFGGARSWSMPEGDAWIERRLKIRTKLGEVKLMRLNRAQLRYSHDCAEKQAKRNIVLKARQVGMTSYIAARFFVQTITRPGTLTMLVAHDRESAEEIFRIVHRFWDNLDEKLRKGVLKTSHNSGRELVFPHLDSEYTVASADENAGRGRTIQNLHCTEVARWGRDAGEALASLRAAVVPGGETVLESTANGAWGPFYEEWQRAEEEGYLQHFFPWWYEESYRCARGKEQLSGVRHQPSDSVIGSDAVNGEGESPHVSRPSKPKAGLPGTPKSARRGVPELEMTEEEEELVRKHGLEMDQILWRRQQWTTLRGLARQEFAEDPVSCFRASGECVFELEMIDEALSEIGEPAEVRENGRVSIWLPPQRGKEYVVGVDPAGGGIDGDYSCAEVIERKSGAQCAELHGHYDLRELAKKLVELGKEYNGALLAVERNNHGHAVLVQLRHVKYPEIYMQGNVDGWNTTVASRPEMIERMAAVVADNPELLRSARLWNECRTFVRHVDGKTGAASGAHDDCVIAMAIALSVREEKAKHRGRDEVSHQPSAIGHQEELGY